MCVCVQHYKDIWQLCLGRKQCCVNWLQLGFLTFTKCSLYSKSAHVDAKGEWHCKLGMKTWSTQGLRYWHSHFILCIVRGEIDCESLMSMLVHNNSLVNTGMWSVWCPSPFHPAPCTWCQQDDGGDDQRTDDQNDKKGDRYSLPVPLRRVTAHQLLQRQTERINGQDKDYSGRDSEHSLSTQVGNITKVKIKKNSMRKKETLDKKHLGKKGIREV